MYIVHTVLLPAVYTSSHVNCTRKLFPPMTLLNLKKFGFRMRKIQRVRKCGATNERRIPKPCRFWNENYENLRDDVTSAAFPILHEPFTIITGKTLLVGKCFSFQNTCFVEINLRFYWCLVSESHGSMYEHLTPNGNVFFAAHKTDIKWKIDR